MDRNQFTGLFLIMLIMVGSFFLLQPSKDEIKKEKERAHADSLRRIGINKTPAVKDTALAVKNNTTVDSALLKTPFGAATVGTEQLVTLENKDLKLQVSTVGGRIYSAELNNFQTFDKKPLVLFDGKDNHFGFKFKAGGKVLNTNDLHFTSVSNQNGALTMRLSYSPTQYVDYVYTLPSEGYKVALDVKPTGVEGITNIGESITLNWDASLKKLEKDIKMERQYSGVYYHNTDGDVDYLTETKDDTKQLPTDKKLNWVAFKQHFFSSVLTAKSGFGKTTVAQSTDLASADIKQMKADVTVQADGQGSFPMEFYFIPNKFDVLKKQDDGLQLEKLIYLGWGPLKYINRFAVLPVFNFLQQFGWNMGIIILALTFLLKLVLSPLTFKSYLSMAKMRVLKPEMDDIKAKVGEDNPTLLQQEYLKLYRKAGVNPLGGCLPLLLQMPIVIAFFRFFPSLFELRGQSFLWMHDLSTYDTLLTFAPLPILGWTHISAMCLLMTISTLIYTYFNNQISGASGQMKYIGYISPLIFFGVLNSYPAGLNYYYFLANMMTFAQQYVIRLMVDDKKIHAQIQENKNKPEDKKKKTGFSARLEEVMRAQQAAQAQQKKK
ncbi:membrane protein insertase YidC [Mucilaginibacter ginkgonis]|uniref:Membrane protein insertase YidC n=1 Tax=Mucilaginibacter ginkgonis TaxID=2682091 RepID=A0A6I4I0Q9_9SPHI|nr:membrane protein insertase YidC [Mucilaginibacter ginkgonis]QQL48418.1 membrane protein insertase YidC [Mucilaginibacter ginkgonis]